MSRWSGLLVLLVACGHPRGNDSGRDAAGTGDDASDTILDAARGDDGGGTGDDGGGTGDDGGGTGSDGGVDPDAMIVLDDASVVVHDAAPDAPAGIITGGPCSSTTDGATAYRIRWANGGGTAYVVYEVYGLPDTSSYSASANGYQIGFTPSYVDPYLAQGGLLLDGSDFVDLHLSTVGVSQITSATLAVYGRSFNTTASGSFYWQTIEGVGSTPTNFVSNVAPYQWYAADMTTEISPGKSGVLIRIKAGPSSGSLVVNRIELCMQAS